MTSKFCELSNTLAIKILYLELVFSWKVASYRNMWLLVLHKRWQSVQLVTENNTRYNAFRYVCSLKAPYRVVEGMQQLNLSTADFMACDCILPISDLERFGNTFFRPL